MSRNILKEKGYTQDQIVELYMLTRNLRQLEKDLGISRKTLSKILDRAGLALRPGRKKGTPNKMKDYHYSCLAEWLRKHSGIPLPRSIVKISQLTGCTKDEVKSYIYRRRRSIAKRLKKLPYGKSTGTLKSIDGNAIPFKAWKEILKIKVDQFSFHIHFWVLLKNNQEREFIVDSWKTVQRKVLQNQDG